MLVILTEDSGYPALVNTEYLVTATVEKTKPPKEPVYTVLAMTDGSNLRVQEDPNEILDSMTEYLGLYDPEEDDVEPA